MQAFCRLHRVAVLLFVAAGLTWADAASAITLRIDYSTDTGSFFGAGNPDGAAAGTDAKAALDAAALFYSNILHDTFSAITPPTKFYGSLGGEATWYWKRKFPNPETGRTNTKLNESFSADEYVIFVGARELGEEQGADVAGLAGPGGFAVRSAARNGAFTSDERDTLDELDEDFLDAVSMRGEASGFANWGGSIAFDTNTNWHFDHTTDPTAGTADFYSVALHELAHTLGFGAVDNDDTKDTPWEKLVSGMNFTGSNANSHYTPSEQVPLASADDKSHWLQSISSTVFGEDPTTQTPLMVPKLDNSEEIDRLDLTDLDAAALVDIGWEINLPAAAAAATAASLNVDTSFSGSAGVAALSVSVVPEPAGMTIAVLGALFALASRSRLHRSL